MNIQICVQVPKAPDAASYTNPVDIDTITDPVLVGRILSTIIAFEAEQIGLRTITPFEIERRYPISKAPEVEVPGVAPMVAPSFDEDSETIDAIKRSKHFEDGPHV